MFFPKYSPKKSTAAIKLESLYNGKVNINKWTLVIFGIILAASLVVLAASIGISLSSKPNGLFNESCFSKSCETTLGLKCINKKCICPENQFYIDKCYNRSSFNSICKQNDHCKQDEILICGLISRCTCESNKYWDLSFKKCLPRKKIGEFCDGDQCEYNYACEFGFCSCRNSEL